MPQCPKKIYIYALRSFFLSLFFSLLSPVSVSLSPIFFSLFFLIYFVKNRGAFGALGHTASERHLWAETLGHKNWGTGIFGVRTPLLGKNVGAQKFWGIGAREKFQGVLKLALRVRTGQGRGTEIFKVHVVGLRFYMRAICAGTHQHA